MTHNISQRGFIAIICNIIGYLLWSFTIEPEYFSGYVDSSEVQEKQSMFSFQQTGGHGICLDSREEIHPAECKSLLCRHQSWRNF